MGDVDGLEDWLGHLKAGQQQIRTELDRYKDKVQVSFFFFSLYTCITSVSEYHVGALCIHICHFTTLAPID